jgi:hypothetical protein
MGDGLSAFSGTGAYPSRLPQEGAQGYVQLMAGISKAQDFTKAYAPLSGDSFHLSEVTGNEGPESAGQGEGGNFGKLLASFMNENKEL